ncbi:siderophore-interacting protein [Amycolatopsis sp. WAC 04169]|uniref:siderophore-interacting protein n=1 Tax=Amycolatopsis sp. WAC 04169 TaxID=2203197 RepID=UPI0018F5C54C|nr:siderophore-interacting protein [Amycolatopsis sp. WAC 04169]
MAEARRAVSTTRLRVLRTERITPHMVRIVAGGEEIGSFRPNDFTDAYVKVHFRVPGVSYPEPFDLARIREELPREQWPRMRSYTVRAFDANLGELVLDFVHHGDEGVAGPWAAAAKPGDELLISGPGGAYAPGEEADWHLLAGDESALPAIAASLEAMPAGVPVHAFILVEDSAEEQSLTTKGDARITWLHRSRGDDLAAAVRALEWREGVVQAFVHGEAGFVRDLRRHLLDDRGMRRDLLSISGYWRIGKTDEAWRLEKQAERNA